MKQIKLKQIGFFTKTHGVHGQLVLRLGDTISFDLLDKGLIEKEAVFVELDGIPVPFFISENGIRELNDRSILLKLDDIDNEKAKNLYPRKVFLNAFYLSDNEQINYDNPKDWIGFSVTDKQLGAIGAIKDFIDIKENPLLSIDQQGNEILLPLLAGFITLIDVAQKQIATELPDGYLEALL